MGLIRLLTGTTRDDINSARRAVHETEHPQGHPDAVTSHIWRILSVGLDGRGKITGSRHLAGTTLAAYGGDVERAIERLENRGTLLLAGGCFATSVGGFFTMLAAVPLNVFTFYTVLTRRIGAIVTLRGYDIDDPRVRTAILLSISGSDPSDILRQAGIPIRVGTLGQLANLALPTTASMLVNKAIGFQLLAALTQKTLARFGRAIPLLGGALGAIMDGALASKILHHVRAEFVPVGLPLVPAQNDHAFQRRR